MSEFHTTETAHNLGELERFDITLFDTLFAHVIEWVGFYQVAFVALFLLGLSLFFPRTGEFTRFTNKLGFGYLLIIFWLTSFQISFKTPLYSFSALPNHVYPKSWWATSLEHDYEIGIWDMIIANFQSINSYMLFEEDNFFSKIFFVYALFIVSVFLYGIADRFFVANSYEIEFSLLVFFIHLGGLFLFSVSNVIEFVLAIEIVTLATYALTAFDRKNRFSAEAGVQYFILGSLPSGLLVLGTALLYKSWGTLGFADLDLLLTDTVQPISKSVTESLDKRSPSFIPVCYVRWDEAAQEFYCIFPSEESRLSTLTSSIGVSEYDLGDEDLQFFDFDTVFASATPFAYTTLAAIFLIFFNFLFKLTAAPFHFWAPSIYGKAPLASVTFLSIFSKGMIFFALTKFLFTLFHAYFYILLPFLIFVSVLSVLFGMIGAFAEKGIKRFFVYSSMGHVGFMLLGLSLSTREGLSATFHYLPVYIITSFIMWFILLDLGEEKNELIHFSILKNSNSLLALIFSLIIFSMSGIPPLGGFFVKLDILAALLESSRFYTNFLLLFFTVASFFYYLRVVKIIFFDDNNNFETNKYRSEERLWMISLLFIILLFYLFLVEKPLLEIQMQALSSIL